LVLRGVPFGDVFPQVVEIHHEQFRRWFVHEPRVPNLLARSGSGPQQTGNPCRRCGGPNLVRTGTCMTCLDCGENEGCG
jgi:hypothetical protein